MAAVSGTIVLPAGAVIPDGATWTIEIQDTTLADAPATVIGGVTADVADPTAAEIPFEVRYDLALIDEAATYTLYAVIEDATPAMLFTNDTAIPVITGGAPTAGVTVDVVPVTGPLAEMSPLAVESAAA
jgi:putative lipoprotein